jgi:hypothetical protein
MYDLILPYFSSNIYAIVTANCKWFSFLPEVTPDATKRLDVKAAEYKNKAFCDPFLSVRIT